MRLETRKEEGKREKTIDHCNVCPCAKQTRIPFPISTSKSFACFDLLHMDLWGPYKTPTYDGCKYFLIIVDDMSRYTWIFLLKLKSDVVLSLNSY